MGKGTTHSETEEIPCPPLKPRNPVDQDPYFIKAGCHLGAFVMAAVNTEAEHANIQVLQGDLDSALTWINVSSWICSYSFLLSFNLLPFAENHRAFIRKR
jgi:hypothetical protein